MRFGLAYKKAMPVLDTGMDRLTNSISTILQKQKEKSEEERVRDILGYRPEQFAPRAGSADMTTPDGRTVSVPTYSTDIQERMTMKRPEEIDPAAITEMLLMKSGAGEKGVRVLDILKRMQAKPKRNVMDLSRGGMALDTDTGQVVGQNPYTFKPDREPSALDAEKQQLALRILEQELKNKQALEGLVRARASAAGRKKEGAQPKKADLLVGLGRLADLRDKDAIDDAVFEELSGELLRQYQDIALAEFTPEERASQKAERYLKANRDKIPESLYGRMLEQARKAGQPRATQPQAAADDTVLDYVPGQGFVRR